MSGGPGSSASTPSCSTRLAAIRAPLSQAGGDTLARAELSAVGRQCVDTALRRIGELSTEIDPLRTQLASFAKHQAGCRALRLVHQEPDWTADSV
jgi:hypothetical protein